MKSSYGKGKTLTRFFLAMEGKYGVNQESSVRALKKEHNVLRTVKKENRERHRYGDE